MQRILLLFAIAGCDNSSQVKEPGFHLGIEFDVAPGEEAWKCQIQALDVDGVQNVHKVRHQQSSTVHHMDLMVLLSSGVLEPPGMYDCRMLYDKYPGLMEDTTLYAAQKANDEILLPEGIVAKVPPGLTVMYEVHIVNAKMEKVHVSSQIDAVTIPTAQVTGSIWGGAVRDRYINVPANGQTIEWSRCKFDKDVDVILLNTHTHELATKTEIVYSGQVVYENLDWQAPKILQLAQPIHVAAGDGFEFRCYYSSERPTPTQWGFSAKDEMCQMAVVFTPGESNAACKVYETSDGVIME